MPAAGRSLHGGLGDPPPLFFATQHTQSARSQNEIARSQKPPKSYTPPSFRAHPPPSLADFEALGFQARGFRQPCGYFVERGFCDDPGFQQLCPASCQLCFRTGPTIRTSASCDRNVEDDICRTFSEAALMVHAVCDMALVRDACPFRCGLCTRAPFALTTPPSIPPSTSTPTPGPTVAPTTAPTAAPTGVPTYTLAPSLRAPDLADSMLGIQTHQPPTPARTSGSADAMCEDVRRWAEQCLVWAGWGYCEVGSVFHPLVLSNCRLSCGSCRPEPDAPRPGPTPGPGVTGTATVAIRLPLTPGPPGLTSDPTLPASEPVTAAAGSAPSSPRTGGGSPTHRSAPRPQHENTIDPGKLNDDTTDEAGSSAVWKAAVVVMAAIAGFVCLITVATCAVSARMRHRLTQLAAARDSARVQRKYTASSKQVVPESAAAAAAFASRLGTTAQTCVGRETPTWDTFGSPEQPSAVRSPAVSGRESLWLKELDAVTGKPTGGLGQDGAPHAGLDGWCSNERGGQYVADYDERDSVVGGSNEGATDNGSIAGSELSVAAGAPWQANTAHEAFGVNMDIFRSRPHQARTCQAASEDRSHATPANGGRRRGLSVTRLGPRSARSASTKSLFARVGAAVAEVVLTTSSDPAVDRRSDIGPVEVRSCTASPNQPMAVPAKQASDWDMLFKARADDRQPPSEHGNTPSDYTSGRGIQRHTHMSFINTTSFSPPPEEARAVPSETSSSAAGATQARPEEAEAQKTPPPPVGVSNKSSPQRNPKGAIVCKLVSDWDRVMGETAEPPRPVFVARPRLLSGYEEQPIDPRPSKRAPAFPDTTMKLPPAVLNVAEQTTNHGDHRANSLPLLRRLGTWSPRFGNGRRTPTSTTVEAVVTSRDAIIPQTGRRSNLGEHPPHMPGSQCSTGRAASAAAAPWSMIVAQDTDPTIALFGFEGDDLDGVDDFGDPGPAASPTARPTGRRISVCAPGCEDETDAPALRATPGVAGRQSAQAGASPNADRSNIPLPAATAAAARSTDPDDVSPKMGSLDAAAVAREQDEDEFERLVQDQGLLSALGFGGESTVAAEPGRTALDAAAELDTPRRAVNSERPRKPETALLTVGADTPGVFTGKGLDMFDVLDAQTRPNRRTSSLQRPGHAIVPPPRLPSITLSPLPPALPGIGRPPSEALAGPEARSPQAAGQRVAVPSLPPQAAGQRVAVPSLPPHGNGSSHRNATPVVQPHAISARAQAQAVQSVRRTSGSQRASWTRGQSTKLQLAIAEVAASEEAYLKDVDALIQLLLIPMHRMSIAGGGVDDTLGHEAYQAMVESAELLLATGKAFLQAMSKRRAAEAAALETGAGTAGGCWLPDVTLKFVPHFQRAFLAYCRTSVHLNVLFRNMSRGFKTLLQKAQADPLCRRLPPDAFVLAPIQRVTRYPILLAAVLNATATDPMHACTDHEDADAVRCAAAVDQLKYVARMCNERIESMSLTRPLAVRGKKTSKRSDSSCDAHVSPYDSRESRAISPYRRGFFSPTPVGSTVSHS